MSNNLFQWLRHVEGWLVLGMDLLLTLSLLWLAYRLLDRLASRLFLGGDRHSFGGFRLLTGAVFVLCGLASMAPVLVQQAAAVPLGLLGQEYVDWYVRCLALLPCIWLGGVLFHGLRYQLRRAGAMRAVARLPAAFTGDGALAEAAMHSGVTRPPPCKCADVAGGVALCGFREPVLVVAPSFLRRHSHEERYLMYLHECAHIRRRDHLRFLLCDLWEILFWFFPPLRREAQYARERCEIACDSLVLQTGGVRASAYRGLLLRRAAPSPRYQIGFSGSGFRELQARIRATGRKLPHRAPRAAACGCIVLLGALLFCRHTQTLSPPADGVWGLKIVFCDQSEDVRLLSPGDALDADSLLALVNREYPGENVQRVSLCWTVFYWNGILCSHSIGDGSLLFEVAAVFF